MTSDVSLRDLLVAWRALRPRSEAARLAIARMLGHDLTPKKKKPPRVAQLKKYPVPPASIVPDEVKQTPAPAAPRQRLEPVASDAPAQSVFDGVEALAAGSAASAEPELAPLFDRRFTRDILTNALATDSPSGPVDLDELVSLLSRAKAVLTVPRQPWPTLLRGAQVLVDIGEGMEPFAADQEQLISELRRVLACDVVSFRGCPSRGAGAGPVWSWTPYRAPAPGTPLLLLSDLGAGGPALHPGRSTLDEWLRFLAGLSPEAGPVVAFTPYSPKRYPRELRRALAVVCWDRMTTPRTAFLARRGEGVR